VYEELIFKICATNVGSFGIQFPIMIRPPGRVMRTISLATSSSLGANIAPKMLTTRSNVWSLIRQKEWCVSKRELARFFPEGDWRWGSSSAKGGGKRIHAELPAVLSPSE
jgi:hypothetical protein